MARWRSARARQFTSVRCCRSPARPHWAMRCTTASSWRCGTSATFTATRSRSEIRWTANVRPTADARGRSGSPQTLGWSAVVGTSCSAAAVAASPVIGKAGLVMVSPSNTSPVLTSDLRGNPGSDHHAGYFRVSNNDLHGAVAVAGFAYGELGLRRMASVHDGDPYTTALVGAFADAFRARGGEVVAEAGIEKGERDMTAVLATFAAAAPDGVFFPLFVGEGSAFAVQAREFDGLQDVTLITGAAMLVSEFLGSPPAGIYIVGPESSRGSSVNVGDRQGRPQRCSPPSRRPTASHPIGRTPTTPRRCSSPPSSLRRWRRAGRSTWIARGSGRRWERWPGFRASRACSPATRSATAAPHQHLPPYGLSHYRRRAACGGLPVQPLRGPVHVQASDCTCRSVRRRVGRMSGR